MTQGFGQAIRRRREAVGMLQTELAYRAGVEQPHLSDIERGKIALPNAGVRRSLAGALGMSHAALLVEAGELTAEEAGLAGIDYRPPALPFPPGDPRRLIADALAGLRHDDAAFALIVVQAMVERRRSLGVEEAVGNGRGAEEEGARGLGLVEP